MKNAKFWDADGRTDGRWLRQMMCNGQQMSIYMSVGDILYILSVHAALVNRKILNQLL